MWTISLPLSVPVTKKKFFSLNLNIYRNAHYMVLNKAKSAFTDRILGSLKKLPPQNHISLTYRIFLPNNRKADISNIGSIVDKFFSDALVDAGVIPDDNYLHLTHVQFFFGGIDRVDPRVEVTISPVNEKEQIMRIILTQEDLQTALKNYINDKIIIQDGQELSIEMTDDGAELVIGEATKTAAKPAKRAVRAKKEEPVVESVEEADTALVEEEEALDEVVEETPTEEEEVKPKAKSLFGGLQRPKN